MIHINLLPPELRKRHGGVSPVFLSLAGGVLVCVLMAISLIIVISQITNANALLVSKDEELTQKKQLAQEVVALEAKIVEAKAHRDYVVTLLSQKMYWAKTLDEFVNTLNGPWSLKGYDVRCLDLTIAQAGAASASPKRGQSSIDVAYSVTWRYKILGENPALNGDYIQSFFDTLAGSRLWIEHGFSGKPGDSFHGLVPRWEPNVERTIIENTLQWQRVKSVTLNKSTAGSGGN